MAIGMRQNMKSGASHFKDDKTKTAINPFMTGFHINQYRKVKDACLKASGNSFHFTQANFHYSSSKLHYLLFTVQYISTDKRSLPSALLYSGLSVGMGFASTSRALRR
ncbi:hypothetical protein PGTUg99_003190 [Puccinia graminis f. sp. tritici]|nr:hypothetical protein PGTUg99_003190 [Puccinia graminis f. sp. tritici]